MSNAYANEPLTRSVEDYLKAVYRLSLNGQPATTSELAANLDLAAPSVSGMVKRLSEHGLLEHLPYKGVVLTEEGRRRALRVVRRHRIIEAYLVTFLGCGWETVHEEAEQLEHAVSDPLIERMAQMLGDPRFDPHGDPIPAPDGSITELPYTPLAEVVAGTAVEIRRVDTSQPDRLGYIASIGLIPGARVTVVDHQPFHGPISVAVGEKVRVLGHEIGCQLLCTPIEPSTR